MVSEQPFWPWGVTSDEEKQVEVRVINLKSRIDELQSHFQEEIGVMKSEIRKDMSRLLEKFEVMTKKWEGLEQDRKEKGLTTNSTETTVDSEIPLKTHEAGKSIVVRIRREEFGEVENESRPPEMPRFMGDNITGSCFREEIRQPLISWEEIKILLLKHSQPSNEGTILENFMALRQEETDRDHRRQFEVLAAPLRASSESVREGSFIIRLNPIIRAEVLRLKPPDLDHNMELAQWVNDSSKSLKEAQIISGPITTYSPKYHQIILILIPNLLQLGKRLYHRWKEKITVEHGLRSLERVKVRKEGVIASSPKPPLSTKIPLKIEEIWAQVKGRSRLNETWQSENRGQKLEMPDFNGEILDKWLFRAERYFNRNQFSDWDYWTKPAEKKPPEEKMSELIEGRNFSGNELKLEKKKNDGKLLDSMDLDLGKEVVQSVDGGIWTLELQTTENTSYEFPITLVQFLEIPQRGATGYGVCMNNILTVGGRHNYEFTPKMVHLYGISNFEVQPHLHLEDKVDFEAAGNDRCQSSSHGCCHVIVV